MSLVSAKASITSRVCRLLSRVWPTVASSCFLIKVASCCSNSGIDLVRSNSGTGNKGEKGCLPCVITYTRLGVGQSFVGEVRSVREL